MGTIIIRRELLSYELDINQLRYSSMLKSGGSMKRSFSINQSHSTLESIFTHILESCIEAIGPIENIGIKFDGPPESPNHMLVVFPDLIIGFQDWNDANISCQWTYSQTEKKLKKNKKNSDDIINFLMFVQLCLKAIQNQSTHFVKNIQPAELSPFL
jgi:hypothetical protein